MVRFITVQRCFYFAHLKQNACALYLPFIKIKK
uniref:Uncharacterized protein n=1 Tax=Anguilla anguilla TaxID=7936 RepID=A0A0E9T8S1_ANGAN